MIQIVMINAILHTPKIDSHIGNVITTNTDIIYYRLDQGWKNHLFILTTFMIAQVLRLTTILEYLITNYQSKLRDNVNFVLQIIFKTINKIIQFIKCKSDSRFSNFIESLPSVEAYLSNKVNHAVDI